MNWIPDSLTVTSEQAVPLLRVLAVFGLGSLLTFGLLRQMAGEALDSVGNHPAGNQRVDVCVGAGALAGSLLDRWLEFGSGWAVFAFALAGLLLLPGWKRHPAPVWALFPARGGDSGRFSALALHPSGLCSGACSFLRISMGRFIIKLSQNLLNHFDRFPWEVTPRRSAVTTTSAFTC